MVKSNILDCHFVHFLSIHKANLFDIFRSVLLPYNDKPHVTSITCSVVIIDAAKFQSPGAILREFGESSSGFGIIGTVRYHFEWNFFFPVRRTDMPEKRKGDPRVRKDFSSADGSYRWFEPWKTHGMHNNYYLNTILRIDFKWFYHCISG